MGGAHKFSWAKERYGLEKADCRNGPTSVIQPGTHWAEIKEPGAHHSDCHGFPNRRLLRTPKFSFWMFLRPYRL